MGIYKTFLLFPIFKSKIFSQNIIFNQENFSSRSNETRSLVEALNSVINFEKVKIIRINDGCSNQPKQETVN